MPSRPDPPEARRLWGARGADFWLGVLPVLMVGFVYLPVLDDYFKSDDFVHLFQIVNYGPLEFLITPHGGHLLSSSNFAFVLCHQFFGLNAVGYQTLAFSTHLLNVWLFYHALRHLTLRPFLAAFGASLWGMAPSSYESVVWFSVYGHVMIGTAVAWILCDVARLSRYEISASIAMRARWSILLLIAATSWGVGLGISAISGLILFLLRPGAADRRGVALCLAPLVLILPALYALQYLAFSRISGGQEIHAYFNAPQIGMTATMFGDLFAIGTTKLLLGPLMASQQGSFTYGPFAGWASSDLVVFSYVISSVFLLATAWSVVRAPSATRSRLFGLMMITAAAYGTVALGRGADGDIASIFASINRYHYVAPMALTAFACLAGSFPLDRVGSRFSFGGTLLIAWAILSTPLYAASIRSFDTSSSEAFRSSHESILAEIEAEAATRPPEADVFLLNRGFPNMWPPDLMRKFPGIAAIFVISYSNLKIEGRKVFFVELDSSVREAMGAYPGDKIMQVLVGPGTRRDKHQDPIRKRKRNRKDALPINEEVSRSENQGSGSNGR